MLTIYSYSARQLEQLHHLYLNEWWAKGRSWDETIACASNCSLLVGVLDEEASDLIGTARVLTDFVFKALILDVIVRQDRRGQGVGVFLMNELLKHDRMKGVAQIDLCCREGLMPFYAKFGFSTDVNDVRLMRLTQR
jgi:GNAT superfamily N-acetyltransferase